MQRNHTPKKLLGLTAQQQQLLAIAIASLGILVTWNVYDGSHEQTRLHETQE